MSRHERTIAMLRAVFHELPEACCLLGAVRGESGQIVDFEVMEVNAAGERALRRDRETLVGRRLAAVFYDEAALDGARCVAMTGEAEEQEIEGWTRRMAPAGDGVAVMLRRVDGATPEPTTEGLERAIGGLAHDFNNLLTPILAYTNLGLAQMRPGDPFHEELLEIRRAAERASQLVSRVQANPGAAQKWSQDDG
jgi:signal transduction histidine kinase